MKTVIKTTMMVFVMFGFLSGCSNSREEPESTEWPGTTQGRGHYFDGQIDNNAIPYLSPQPLGNSGTYIQWQNDAEVSADNHSAFNYPYGNSGTHLNLTYSQ